MFELVASNCVSEFALEVFCAFETAANYCVLVSVHYNSFFKHI